MTIDQARLTLDPTIGLWLFMSMTQVQILLALIGAALSVLKKAMADLATNWGHQTTSNESSSKNGQSFGLKYLKKRSQRSNGLSQPSDSGSRSRPLPYAGPGVSGNAFVRMNRDDKKVRGDGDSQEGIIRQDDFVVSYFPDDGAERDTEDGDRT